MCYSAELDACKRGNAAKSLRNFRAFLLLGNLDAAGESLRWYRAERPGLNTEQQYAIPAASGILRRAYARKSAASNARDLGERWSVGEHPGDGSGTKWRTILRDGPNVPYGPAYVGQMIEEDATRVVAMFNEAAARAEQETLHAAMRLTR